MVTLFLMSLRPAKVETGWCAPLIPTLGRQRQADLCEFKFSLVYITSSRTVQSELHREKMSKRKEKETLHAALQELDIPFNMPTHTHTHTHIHTHKIKTKKLKRV